MSPFWVMSKAKYSSEEFDWSVTEACEVKFLMVAAPFALVYTKTLPLSRGNHRKLVMAPPPRWLCV